MNDAIIIAETERLILRRYKKEDVQDLFEYLSDKEVVKYEPYKQQTFDETKENLEWRISTDEMVAVELKNLHKMIGNVYMGKRDFEALEIGYVFNRNYWGYGYAAESCKANRHFPMACIGYMQSVTLIIRVRGSYLKRWDFSVKLIFEKMCISGKTKPENQFGKIHMYMPN